MTSAPAVFGETHEQVSPYQRDEQADEVCQGFAKQQQVLRRLSVGPRARFLRLEGGKRRGSWRLVSLALETAPPSRADKHGCGGIPPRPPEQKVRT